MNENLTVAEALRQDRHKVFLFCETETDGPENFTFGIKELPEEEPTMKSIFNYWKSWAGFHSDKNGLDWCDTVVLVLPSGRSAHLEAGYAVGQGKDVFVVGPPIKGEFDLMHGFFSENIYYTADQLLRALVVK